MPSASMPFSPSLLRSLQRTPLAHIGSSELHLESDAHASELENYVTALEQLYGGSSEEARMPLAVPFGAYATPSERPSYFASEPTIESPGASINLEANLPPNLDADSYVGQYTSSIDMPSSFARPAFPVPESGAVGYITDYSWGDAGDDGSYQPEVNAWADVVTSAVTGGSTAGAPALALAGAESSPEVGPQRPPNEDKVASPSLDELADTVYSLIRERLAIEKERNFV